MTDTKDKDEIVIICMNTAYEREPLINSVKDKCSTCGSEIWISEGTVKIKEANKDKVKLLCFDHLEEHMDNKNVGVIHPTQAAIIELTEDEVKDLKLETILDKLMN